MLPKILGAVALGVTGYGIKKLLTDEEFRDDVKDKVADGAMKAYDATEWVEEKMGLYDEPVSLDKVLKEYKDAGLDFPDLFPQMANSSDTTKETELDDFAKLYQFKIDIYNKLSKHNLAVVEKSDIKKDKTKNVTITEEMRNNLASYVYLLRTAYNAIQKNMDTDVDISRYINILKNLWTTKIIKKGKVNIYSTDVILKATNMLIINDKFMVVDLSESK